MMAILIKNFIREDDEDWLLVYKASGYDYTFVYIMDIDNKLSDLK